MDQTLYKQYKEVELTKELVQMFADIIMGDEATKKIFLNIGKHTTEEEELGITVGQLVEQTQLNRRVQKGKTFETIHTNIDRKHAERVVSSLLMMGLCYFRSIPPSKVINYTKRGKQVAAEIKRRVINSKKEKGDDPIVKV